MIGLKNKKNLRLRSYMHKYLMTRNLYTNIQTNDKWCAQKYNSKYGSYYTHYHAVTLSPSTFNSINLSAV